MGIKGFRHIITRFQDVLYKQVYICTSKLPTYKISYHIYSHSILFYSNMMYKIYELSSKKNFAQCRYHLSGYMLRIISAYARQVFKVCSRTSVKKLMVCLLAFLSFTSSSCISSQQIKILKGIIHLKQPYTFTGMSLDRIMQVPPHLSRRA